jgi:single-strand DNA-binding protein
MRSVNKVILIGNLTRDPEMKTTQSGQPITTFSIATNREWVTKDGEKHTSTEFHDLIAWSRLAELCAKFLKKGKLVYVEGYLKTRSWEAEDGTKRYRTEIVIDDMIMLDKRTAGGEEDAELMTEQAEGTEAQSEPETEAAAPEEQKSENMF